MSRRVTAEDLLSFRLAGSIQATPAGDRAAFVVSRVNREENKYETAIHLVTPGEEAEPFTGGDADSAPRFSPNGRRLAFISKRSGQPQVWVMSAHGGEARQLTKIQGGVAEFAWSPDGNRIAFTALLKEEGIQAEVKEEKETDLLKKHTKDVKVITELVHKLDGVGHFGELRPCLCVMESKPSAQPVQLTVPPYQVSDLAWTPDSQTILFGGRLGDDYDREAFEEQIYAIPAAGGEARVLTPAGYSCGGAAVSPDGARVAFQANRTDELGYDNTALYVIDLADGAGSFRRLAAEFDRPFSNEALCDMPAPGGARLTWSPDGKSLYAFASINASAHLVRVDVATGKPEVLTRGERMVYSFSLDADCRYAWLCSADLHHPGDVYRLDLATGEEQRVTELNDELLSELEIAVPERFTARSADGTAVDAWVMMPAGFTAGQTYPAVLEIHGGPMGMYGNTFFFEFQLLAAQGWGVIYSNPRGSLGYGEEFCKAIRPEWGKLDYQDLMAVADEALARNGWIDATRVGVTGGSYGGFMTNWIVGHTDRFRAAVTGRSICDWRSMVGSGDGGHYWIKRAGGVAPWVDDSWYKQQSPITYVTNVVTPILIEHEEGDLRCPLDQGMMWYSAIKYLGKVPVRFVTYPGEFHGMSRNGKPWNRIHRLKEIVGWLGEYLG